MKNILIIAPHPDDELLGCGGTLLRHLAAGNQVHWLIVSKMHSRAGYSREQIKAQERLIQRVSNAIGFSSVRQLNFPTTQLDTVPLSEIASSIGQMTRDSQADTLYLPSPNDIHTDHSVVFNAAKGCAKWFRYPEVQRVYAYETLSETDFSLSTDGPAIRINHYVDISEQLPRKLELLDLYRAECDEFPFPRSEKAVEALARLRGAACGCRAAEAFQLLKEVV